MRNIQERADETQKFLGEKREKEIQDYMTWDEKYKQEYWNKYVFTIWWYNERWTSLPISIAKIRDEFKQIENDFNRFIPWIMKSLEEEWFTWTLEDIFILDDSAISYLAIHWTQNENSEKVENSIKKNSSIEWLPYSYEELAEKIGDLFYEPLAGLLSSIASELEKQIDSDEDVIKLLQEASTHILQAWNHCKPHVLDIEELKKNSKHTFEIEWSGLNNQELAKAIAFLENDRLKELLWLLSTKIERDAEADKWRQRLKLAGELFATAEKLRQAAEKI
jgi:hypothetical protein